MSHTIKAGAVLYAKDMDRMAAFYAAVLGLAVADRDQEHVLLASETVELVVRQVPSQVAASILITVPPVRRSDSAVKLVFFVPGMAAVHAGAAAHGGLLDATAKDWLFHGWQVWDGLDPEGNVIQFRAQAG